MVQAIGRLYLPTGQGKFIFGIILQTDIHVRIMEITQKKSLFCEYMVVGISYVKNSYDQQCKI